MARSTAIDGPSPELIDRFGRDVWRVWRAGAEHPARFGVAVSGGPDSIALLLLAAAWKPGLIEAATVDHGLRPESAGEAAFVAAICEKLEVPHHMMRVRVGEGNLQSEARRARYRALGDWAGERDLAAFATAHHADDQAETVLMRLNRSSGLSGLAGIRQTRAMPNTGTLIFRPLLSWRKLELQKLVTDAGIIPVTDPSNEDARFDRARIRAALAKTDWLDPGAITRSAAHLADASCALEWAIGKEWEREVSEREGVLTYRATSAPRAIRLGIIERAITCAGGHDVRGGDVASLEERLRAGGKATLGGVIVEVHRDVWTFRSEPGRDRF